MFGLKNYLSLNNEVLCFKDGKQCGMKRATKSLYSARKEHMNTLDCECPTVDVADNA